MALCEINIYIDFSDFPQKERPAMINLNIYTSPFYWGYTFSLKNMNCFLLIFSSQNLFHNGIMPSL